MYIFETTTATPGATTLRWFGKEPGDYYYYEGGPDVNWKTRPDYFFNQDTETAVITKSEVVDHAVSFVGLFLNLFHFIVLIRKELRTSVVFIIILGICFCDILVFLSSITQRYFSNSEERGMYGGYCGTDKQYWMVFLETLSRAIQKFGRLSSTLLAFLVALIRAVTVVFPMSSIVDRLMKVRTGIFIVLISLALCGARYVQYYWEYSIFKAGTFAS
ncbi:hypothetical protein GCK72_004174 [Caenorhabditis remanei]|uniref:G-protein coupled receptors family 1 profile domain-containing protein n=1 Tax=Caenorhabditis remanei TaxID=31234 RepID=A0A6A5HAQ9_CAERE|nr:hypothetical protein GCK72_004174 [Caenorhabditis remanei]KAF1764227.1 hypothetical protein GCK72_004174 [Caenorhabditis remanei]